MEQRTFLPIALLGMLPLWAISSTSLAQSSGPIFKCTSTRGAITYTNDPDSACPNKKLIDAAKTGHGMSMPATKSATPPEHKTPSKTSPPLMPLERIEKALTGQVSPSLPNPIDKANR